MTVTSKITLDLTRPNIGGVVHAVQGDGNTRCVEITLLSGGSSWEPPADAEVAIAYRQPAMAKGLYNKLADGSPAISVAGNVASIVLAPQMLTISGTVQASLVFSDAQLNRLTTFPFAVSVVSNPAIGAQQTEDYIRLQWLEDKLDAWVQQMMSTEKAVAAAAAAERADAAADNAQEQAAAADTAATAANTAAALANQAKTDAETAASDAASAAANANAAALGADAARDGANSAADAANQAASAAQGVVETIAPDVQQLRNDVSGLTRGYELIEEITVEDGVTILERTKEPDGTYYNFKKMYIRIGDDSNTTQIGVDSAAVRVLANYEWGADKSTYVSCYAIGTMTEIEAVVESGDFIYATMTGRTTPYSGAVHMEKHSRGTHSSNRSIRNITIGQYNGLTAGTIIKIWGVRADA